MSTEKYIGESTLLKLPKKKIGIQLKDGAITEGKLADGSVTTDKIADKTIPKEKLKDDVLTTKNIKDGDSSLADTIEDIYDTTDNIISIIVKSGFNVELSSSNGWSFRIADMTQLRADGMYAAFTTLFVNAKWYAQNVTSKLSNITWTRDTGDEEADALWNKAHAGNKLSISISYEDLGNEYYQIGHVNFTCEAEYNAEGEWVSTKKTVTF